MKEPIWIGVLETLVLHDLGLVAFGGAAGVRDVGGLESALARPRNLLAYGKKKPSLAQFAAAYAFGIIKNHPFIDGNKRTALVVAFALSRGERHRDQCQRGRCLPDVHGPGIGPCERRRTRRVDKRQQRVDRAGRPHDGERPTSAKGGQMWGHPAGLSKPAKRGPTTGFPCLPGRRALWGSVRGRS